MNRETSRRRHPYTLNIFYTLENEFETIILRSSNKKKKGLDNILNTLSFYFMGYESL